MILSGKSATFRDHALTIRQVLRERFQGPPCAPQRPFQPVRGSAFAGHPRRRSQSRRRNSSDRMHDEERRSWPSASFSSVKAIEAEIFLSKTARNRRSFFRAAGAASSQCQRLRAPFACRERLRRPSALCLGGRSVEGPIARTRAPRQASSRIFERATRECRISPQIATVRPGDRDFIAPYG